MDFLQLEWVQPILWLVGIAITTWVIPNTWWAKIVAFLGTKLTVVLNKAVTWLSAGSAMADGAGLEGIGDALEAGSDAANEIEDLPRLLVEYSADGEIDSTELKTLIEEAGEAGVSVKALVVKIIELIKKDDDETEG